MTKKKPVPKLRPDVAETAFRTMLEATGEAEKTLPPSERGAGEKNPEAVKRGARGGDAGGRNRAAKLSSKRRSEIAENAAKARWDKTNETP